MKYFLLLVALAFMFMSAEAIPTDGIETVAVQTENTLTSKTGHRLMNKKANTELILTRLNAYQAAVKNKAENSECQNNAKPAQELGVHQTTYLYMVLHDVRYANANFENNMELRCNELHSSTMTNSAANNRQSVNTLPSQFWSGERSDNCVTISANAQNNPANFWRPETIHS